MSAPYSPAPYWDVFPKSFRLSTAETGQHIPLSIRGAAEAPVLVSSNPEIVDIDENGVLRCGLLPGNAMVMVWSSEARDSIRHVAVELRDPAWFANHPDFRTGGVVHISGLVLNAITTYGVPGASVSIRRSQTGPVVAGLTTDGLGRYEIDLAEGFYFYEASADGFIDAHGMLNVSPGGVNGQDIVLSPSLAGAVARIVLQWGEYPSDLDSHLVGPLPGGSRFHVYYSHEYEPDVAELDVDDTSSYGPETITLLNIIPGVYRYCVHDYSNRGSSTSAELSQSGATVKVFLDNGQEHTFNVPNAPGTVWNVFEIDGATGALTPLNTMDFENNPGQVGQ